MKSIILAVALSAFCFAQDNITTVGKPIIQIQHADRAACARFFAAFQSTRLPDGTMVPPMPWGGCTQNVIVVASGVAGVTGYEITIQFRDKANQPVTRTAYVKVNEYGQGFQVFTDVDDITPTRVSVVAQRPDISAYVDLH